MATQAEVAAHLFITQQAVSKHVASGLFPKGDKRGQLDLDACREAYIRHLREVAAALGPAHVRSRIRSRWNWPSTPKHMEDQPAARCGDVDLLR